MFSFEFCAVPQVSARFCVVSPSAGPIFLSHVSDSEIALNRNGQENTKSVWPQDGRDVIQGWC
jgi:hypothetical protein